MSWIGQHKYLCLPTPDFDDGQHDRIPFFDPPTIELMRRVVCEDVEHHEFKPTGATNLEEEVVGSRGSTITLVCLGGAPPPAQGRGLVGGGEGLAYTSPRQPHAFA